MAMTSTSSMRKKRRSVSLSSELPDDVWSLLKSVNEQDDAAMNLDSIDNFYY